VVRDIKRDHDSLNIGCLCSCPKSYALSSEELGPFGY
jgi:hypothetical protein